LGGTFFGGWLGDRLARRVRNGHLWLSSISTLLAVLPAWAVFDSSSSSVYLTSFVIAEFLLFVSTSPINVTLVSVAPVAIRATAMAMSIFVIHAVGDAISPPIIGAVADRRGLGKAVLMVPLAILIAGLTWTATARMNRAG